MKKTFATVAVTLALCSWVIIVEAYQRDRPNPAKVQREQNDAQLVLRSRCVDLKYKPATYKRSAADLSDLQTCQILKAQDDAKFAQELKEAQRNEERALRHRCAALVNTPISELSLVDLNDLRACRELASNY